MSADRRFIVDVDGFMPEKFVATSAAKARYAAFRKFTEAYRCTFRDFLGKSTIREVSP